MPGWLVTGLLVGGHTAVAACTIVAVLPFLFLVAAIPVWGLSRVVAYLWERPTITPPSALGPYSGVRPQVPPRRRPDRQAPR